MVNYKPPPFSARSIIGAVLAVSAVNLPTMVDALPGSFWSVGTVFGRSCDLVCAIYGDNMCDEAAFGEKKEGGDWTLPEVNNPKTFDEARTGIYPHQCEAGYKDETWSEVVPYLLDNPKSCWYGKWVLPENLQQGQPQKANCAAQQVILDEDGYTYDDPEADFVRVCPCKCAAGTYQPNNGIVTACTA